MFSVVSESVMMVKVRSKVVLNLCDVKVWFCSLFSVFSFLRVSLGVSCVVVF